MKNKKKPEIGSKKTLSDFRQLKKVDRYGNHPVYVFKKVNKDYYVLVLTHDKNNSNKSKVKKLLQNPSPTDTSQVKIHKKARVVDKSLCGQRKQGWMFRNKKDVETVNKIIQENKGKKLERIVKK